jgi:hypothetical protein
MNQEYAHIAPALIWHSMAAPHSARCAPRDPPVYFGWRGQASFNGSDSGALPVKGLAFSRLLSPVRRQTRLVPSMPRTPSATVPTKSGWSSSLLLPPMLPEIRPPTYHQERQGEIGKYLSESSQSTAARHGSGNQLERYAIFKAETSGSEGLKRQGFERLKRL